MSYQTAKTDYADYEKNAVMQNILSNLDLIETVRLSQKNFLVTRPHGSLMYVIAQR